MGITTVELTCMKYISHTATPIKLQKYLYLGNPSRLSNDSYWNHFEQVFKELQPFEVVNADMKKGQLAINIYFCTYLLFCPLPIVYISFATIFFSFSDCLRLLIYKGAL